MVTRHAPVRVVDPRRVAVRRRLIVRPVSVRLAPESRRTIRHIVPLVVAEGLAIWAVLRRAAARLRPRQRIRQTPDVIVSVGSVERAVRLHQVLDELHPPVVVASRRSRRVAILRRHHARYLEALDLQPRVISHRKSAPVAVAQRFERTPRAVLYPAV